MRIRWRGLELPSRVASDRSTLTDTYGKFYAEPFERAVLRLGLTLPLAPRSGTAVVHAHCHARALGAGDDVLAP